MNIEILSYVGMGILIGVILTFILMKLRELENLVYSFPTPEDLAKEIIKVKLPISSLPKGMAESMMGETSSEAGTPPSGFVDKGSIPKYVG